MENNIVEYIYQPDNYSKIIEFYSGKSFVIGNKKNQLPLEFIDMVIGNYGLFVATQVNNRSGAYINGSKYPINGDKESGLVDHLLFTLRVGSNNIYDNGLNVIDPKYTVKEGDEVFISIKRLKRMQKRTYKVVDTGLIYVRFFNKKYSEKYPIFISSINAKHIPEYFRKKLISDQ